MTGLYLAGLVAEHLALTLLPIAAGVLVAVSCGIRDRVVLLLIGLGTLGVLGAATFWVYLSSPRVGRWFAVAALVGCGLALGWSVLRCRSRLGAAIDVLRPLGAPTLFYAAQVGFMTMIGYLRGGMAEDNLAGRNRYMAGLPRDNELPLLFARQLQSSVRPLPKYLVPQWQASDRPPLQTGVYLLEQSVLGFDHFMHYQVIGIALQSLWVFGVWAFMAKTRLPGRVTALALAVIAFSGFTFVNTFFVWPKLFPAAYLMLVAAAVLSKDFARYRRSAVASTAIGVGVGCAMFGHPGSLFVILGLTIALLLARVWPSLKLLVAGGGAAALLYGPWIWFGSVYQPPGNFLIKWQLANARNFRNPTPLTEYLINAYKRAGPHEVLSNKLSNLATPFRDTLRYPGEVLAALRDSLAGAPDARVTRYQVIVSEFHYLIPALSLMALGPVLLLVQWLRLRLRPNGEPRPEYLRIGLLGIVCLLVNYLIWAMILFGPGTTTNVQGSYFMELCGFALGVVGWYTFAPRLCIALVAGQSVFALWLYGVATPQIALHVPPPGAISKSAALGAAAAFVLAMGALYLIWVGRADDGEPSDAEGASDDGATPDRSASRRITEADAEVVSA